MSKKKLTATLKDGTKLDYLDSDNPPSGTMKKIFFSPKKDYVIGFYHDQSIANDSQRIARIEAILTKYNATIPEQDGGARGVTPFLAHYYQDIFCWPQKIVVSPEFGITIPIYPSDFFFETGPFKGKEKNGKWFSSPKLRKLLPDSEKGTWINYLKIGILMARAVSRLHVAGLAHSDLSSNNILIDPVRGRVAVIDIDSLVVPGLFPPDVLGTAGYIAPEVLATQHLPLTDPNRNHPCAATDQHALAVLLYEYLLYRHPLKGPKVNSTTSAEEDERMSMGEKALYVEHPTDRSNRPNNITVEASSLGPILEKLFQRVFIDGLHNPHERPAAIEWEKGLVKTWDLLVPCENSNCPSKWYVFTGDIKSGCPFCNTRRKGSLPYLKLRKETKPGQWMQDSQLVMYHNSSLFSWHAFDNVYSGPLADKSPLAYCVWHHGKWLLVNQSLSSLTSPGGNLVPIGQAVELTDGIQFRLSQEPHGRMVEVTIIQ